MLTQVRLPMPLLTTWFYQKLSPNPPPSSCGQPVPLACLPTLGGSGAFASATSIPSPNKLDKAIPAMAYFFARHSTSACRVGSWRLRNRLASRASYTL